MRLNLKFMLLLLTTVSCSCAFSGNLLAAMVEYTSGHADIGLAVEDDGALFLHYHFGVGSAMLDGTAATTANEELTPAEAYVRVSDAAMTTAPFAIDFLGASQGDPLWILPQTQNSNLAFLGIASEELDPAVYSAAGFRMTGFNGPGNFALFQAGSFGGFNTFFRSNDGVDPMVDFLPSVIGSHDHYNFGFTQEGVYDVTLEGFTTDNLGNTLTDSGTFRFAVGSATAVPEPSSLVLMVAGVAGFSAFSIRRRRLKREKA